MWIVKNESGITYQDTQYVNTQMRILCGTTFSARGGGHLLGKYAQKIVRWPAVR